MKFIASVLPSLFYDKIKSKSAVSLGVMDLESREPNITEAIAAFKRNGARLVFEEEWMYKLMGLDKIKPDLENYEEFLLGWWKKDKERRPLGIATASFFGLKSVETIQEFFLRDEVFGVLSQAREGDTGCLACFDTLFFLNKDQMRRSSGSGDNCLANVLDGTLNTDLTCLFDTKDVSGSGACQSLIKSTKERLNKVVMESEGEIKQYRNLPSCDNPQSEGYIPFYERCKHFASCSIK